MEMVDFLLGGSSQDPLFRQQLLLKVTERRTLCTLAVGEMNGENPTLTMAFGEKT